jgi:methylated-DNA-[protein]-cysteine S-methyltransferase
MSRRQRGRAAGGASTSAAAYRCRTVPTLLGPVTLASDGAALTGVFMDAHRHRPDLPAADPAPCAVLDAAEEQLLGYLAGERRGFDLPLQAEGTPFQREVWAALQAIPYGKTTSYGALAARLGRPGAARAVGLANGRNPLSIVVPCHRVIGAGGTLTGYGGGLERKRFLLALESRATAPG